MMRWKGLLGQAGQGEVVAFGRMIFHQPGSLAQVFLCNIRAHRPGLPICGVLEVADLRKLTFIGML